MGCIFTLCDLNKKNKQQIELEQLEKERDFYFNKLLEIEVICQDNEGMSHIKDIMDALYATEEGFAPPEDDPELDGGEQENMKPIISISTYFPSQEGAPCEKYLKQAVAAVSSSIVI